MKLVVTIPALNEEKTIAQVVTGVPRDIPGISDVEVLVVNDGSTDRTAEMAESAGAIVLNVTGRPGLGSIFRSGLERAMRRGADIVVNIDGDGQFNPVDIAKLVEPILRDDADFVTCSRFADPRLYPDMPTIKFYGNRMVTRIINWVCGGTSFTDVSCGFRAFSREAAYRMTLFGRFTYTQECFIDLFAKGLRIAEVPLKVRGVREHGKSRMASSIWKYATSSLPIILRAMRDIQPLKFFGAIALAFFIPGLVAGLFVTGWYLVKTNRAGEHVTSPFTSLITISGVLITLSVIMGVLALLADMLGRHRRISEELLYLARRRIYSTRRTVRMAVASPSEQLAASGNGAVRSESGVSGDTWAALPVMRSVGDSGVKNAGAGAVVGASVGATVTANTNGDRERLIDEISSDAAADTAGAAAAASGAQPI
ncbi:MAG TPA: glycosyltransferase family 2 protein [Tepidisphaeraceae bacterium]|jgi:glycosyltransferase involved in cell wall biosynthesis